jgi:hypothetical protein
MHGTMHILESFLRWMSISDIDLSYKTSRSNISYQTYISYCAYLQSGGNSGRAVVGVTGLYMRWRIKPRGQGGCSQCHKPCCPITSQNCQVVFTRPYTCTWWEKTSWASISISTTIHCIGRKICTNTTVRILSVKYIFTKKKVTDGKLGYFLSNEENRSRHKSLNLSY